MTLRPEAITFLYGLVVGGLLLAMGAFLGFAIAHASAARTSADLRPIPALVDLPSPEASTLVLLPPLVADASGSQ